MKWLDDLGRCCAGGHHQNGDPFLRAGRERAAGHTARPHCVPRHDAVGRGEAEGAVQRRGAGDAPTRVAAAPQGARPWASSNGRGSGRHGPQMSRRTQRSRVCLKGRVVCDVCQSRGPGCVRACRVRRDKESTVRDIRCSGVGFDLSVVKLPGSQKNSAHNSQHSSLLRRTGQSNVLQV